jgi:hypothetical protein
VAGTLSSQYSGSPGLKPVDFWWLRSFMGFFSLSSRDTTSNRTTAVLFYLLFGTHSTDRQYVVWATECVVDKQ